MIKTAPTLGRIMAMVVFALSCFGIVLYLWLSFGGVLPLKAKGYRFSADFKEAILLAQNADVRISGVPVGKVVRAREHPGVTRVTMEIDAKYAPIPRDTHAILRRKTALGEAYVELSPGNPRSGDLADGGQLPSRQVKSTVELDELVRDFDETTRTAMKRFVTGLAVGLSGRGQDVNDSVGNLDPLAGDTSQVLDSLDRQRAAVRQLIGDTGVVFGALGRRQGELSGIIRAGDRILSTTARRNRELAETVEILPTTLRELRPTFRQIESFSNEARPVVRALRPAGRSLGEALVSSRALAPDLRGHTGIRASRPAAGGGLPRPLQAGDGHPARQRGGIHATDRDHPRRRPPALPAYCDSVHARGLRAGQSALRDQPAQPLLRPPRARQARHRPGGHRLPEHRKRLAGGHTGAALQAAAADHVPRKADGGPARGERQSLVPSP
jgi:virulence factor Mce-like protein